MSDIFISYASADRQQAETLAQGLKAQGWTVWWDRTIPTGRTFDEVIEEALDAAKSVIVLWSEKSVKSNWVRAEAQEGADRKILIPVLIEKVRIPLAFRLIQAANLIGWDGSYTASSFQGLVGDIAAILGPPPKEEEKRKQAEAEAKRKAEEERKRAEAEAKRKAEEERKQAEAKAKRKAEEERQQAEAKAKHKDVEASEQIKVIPTSEPTPDELDHRKPPSVEVEKAASENRKVKVLAAVCIVAFVATISTVYLLVYFRTFHLEIYNTVGGTVRKSPDKASYDRRELVALMAVPDQNYTLDRWSGDLSGSVNPATLVMDADKSVNANFALKTHSLTASAVHGNVTRSPDQTMYDHGKLVTIHAVPNKDYFFTSWSGDLSGSANPTTLVMDADKSVTATFAAFKVQTDSIDMKLIYIPAGSFMMGSSDSAEDLIKEYAKEYEEYKERNIGVSKSKYEELLKRRYEDEFPQHEVRISKGFWIGQTEVTQGQYESVMDAQPWSEQNYVKVDAKNPAVYVRWYDAVEFCKKLTELESQEGETYTYRLPTEAEWEYACRAGTTTRFNFGDNGSSLGDYEWFEDNADKAGQEYARPVGQKKPNSWGLYDMHGNVYEWCSDRYDKDYYSNSPSVDPKGSSRNRNRTFRGGSWRSSEDDLRCSQRSPDSPSDRMHTIGFRVVRSQP